MELENCRVCTSSKVLTHVPKLPPESLDHLTCHWQYTEEICWFSGGAFHSTKPYLPSHKPQDSNKNRCFILLINIYLD